MKKSIFIAITLLLAFGFSACGEEHHSSGKKGGGSSIVIPPGGITPSNPSGGDNQGGDNNQGGGDDNPGGGDEPGGGGDDDSPKPGDKCEIDVCKDNQALHCNANSVYERRSICTDGKICALFESDSVVQADCFEPCSEEEANSPVSACQSDYGLVWSVTGTCSKSHDNKYIKITDSTNPNNITLCSGDCSAGKCVVVDPDEGKPCDPDNYTKHCSGNALVFCAPQTKTVDTINCATKDGANACSDIGGSAKCSDTTRTCTKEFAHEYICDDSLFAESGKYSLIAYECHKDSQGNFVSTRDEFFSAPYCGDSCDPEKGVCCDTATGVCNKTVIEDDWPPFDGGNCSQEACYNNKAYHCNTFRVYEERSCNDSEICAIIPYNSYEFSGCFEACSSAEVNQKVSSCQSNFGKTWTVDGTCTASIDDKYVKVVDSSTADSIVMCQGDCKNGSCEKLDPHEGESCNPTGFNTHCTDNAYVFCDPNTKVISAISCLSSNGDNSCAVFKNNAMCINNAVSCSEEFAITYSCDTSTLETDGKFNLFVYECHADDNGTFVGVQDTSSRIMHCGDSCDAATGKCCDSSTGECNK